MFPAKRKRERGLAGEAAARAHLFLSRFALAPARRRAQTYRLIFRPACQEGTAEGRLPGDQARARWRRACQISQTAGSSESTMIISTTSEKFFCTNGRLPNR